MNPWLRLRAITDLRSPGEVLVLGCCLFACACGSTLMNQRVESRAKDWTLTVREVSDGPNSISFHNMNHVPADDGRFLHVFVTLRNDAQQKRSWNWPRCGLDHGNEEMLPSIIMYDMIVNSPADEVAELDPGEAIERRVIFTYPEKGSLPTRLKCGELVIPLKLSQ
ncbi:MAG: hypothetical protein QM784_19445 [Polyangiaceae bacterium]